MFVIEGLGGQLCDTVGEIESDDVATYQCKNVNGHYRWVRIGGVPEASTSASVTPSVSASSSLVGGGQGTLPVTGLDVDLIVGVGFVAIVVGLALFALSKLGGKR